MRGGLRTDLTVEDLGNFLQEPRVAVLATLRKDVARYNGKDEGAAYVKSTPGEHLIARLEPGNLRAWDFADETHTV